MLTALAPVPERPDVQAKLLAPARLGAGSKGSVVVEMTIGPGWHVNSHTPSDKFLVPTEVALTATVGTLSAFRYPKDVEKRFSFSDKPLRVYENTVRFEADLWRTEGADADIALRGALSYQACNDRQCFAPAKIPLEATVAASTGGEGR
jgi:DsbC/DsbD-like thiol-disulfide interchange protein